MAARAATVPDISVELDLATACANGTQEHMHD
jgi:hypothetical protein